MKNIIRNTIIATVAVAAIACTTFTASAAISFAGYYGDTTDSTTATFTQLGTDINDGILGYDVVSVVGGNPQHAFYESNATNGNTRYTRFRFDMRGGQNEIVPQNQPYFPAPIGYDSGSNPDVWNVTSWSNSLAVGVNQGFLRFSGENWPDDGNTTDIGTPWHGFQEGLNWALFASNDGNTLGSATVEGWEVYAMGVVWVDNDVDGNIDTGDNLYVRYVFGADDFSEIDTKVELEQAVGIPEPGTLVLLGLGGLVLLRRRRS